MLDEGRLTDNKGRTVNFKNTVIIMTSNLGSHLIQERLSVINEENFSEILGELRVKLSELLKNTIRPEFLNRIDEIILFKPLLKNELVKIIDLQLHQLGNILLQKGIRLEVKEGVKEFLLQAGYDVTFGARPLKRTIQKFIINPLSTELLMGKYEDGNRIILDLDEKGRVAFRK